MDGDRLRSLALTVRYAAAGIARQALNVLLIPVYTIYLDPTDFGVLALQEAATQLSEAKHREREDWAFQMSLLMRKPLPGV